MGGSRNEYGGVALRRMLLFLTLALMMAAATSAGAFAQAQEEASPPTPQCDWYENPERGWGSDYWCYHPTQLYWEPAFFGVTLEDVRNSEGTLLVPRPYCDWYDNGQTSWDYWCSHPTQLTWEPVFRGVTFD